MRRSKRWRSGCGLLVFSAAISCHAAHNPRLRSVCAKIIMIGSTGRAAHVAADAQAGRFAITTTQYETKIVSPDQGLKSLYLPRLCGASREIPLAISFYYGGTPTPNLISFCSDWRIRIFDCAERALKLPPVPIGSDTFFKANPPRVSRLSANGWWLGILDESRRLTFWETRSGKLMAVLEHSDFVPTDFALTSDGNQALLWNATDGRVRWVDPHDGRILRTDSFPPPILAGDVTDSGNPWLMVHQEGLSVLDRGGNEIGHSLNQTKGPAVTEAVFTKDHQSLLVGFNDGTTMLLDKFQNEPAYKLKGMPRPLPMAFVRDSLLYGLSPEDKVLRWDLNY